MCNFSSHSRSGRTTLYHIYRLVMGSWRQTRCRATSGAGWSGRAHHGLTAASLPPSAACEDGHLFRRSLSLGLPSAQREPHAPERAHFLRATPRPRGPISEPVMWSFPFPFPCEQEVTPGPQGRGLETPSILKLWQELLTHQDPGGGGGRPRPRCFPQPASQPSVNAPSSPGDTSKRLLHPPSGC